MKNLYKSFTVLLLVLITSLAFSLPKLSSLPSAPATIYLDFDGQTVNSAVWNGGLPLVCAAAPLSDAQITEIFNRVSEDYRPFDINITTDSTVFLKAPLKNRMRVIITPSSSWKTGVGGVGYIGSFTWGDDTPAFVFSDRLGPNNAKYIAECCSHESGHTVGLSHQASFDGNCALVETYNSGVGTGETSWAPVMGNGYYRNMTGWNNGPTPTGCNNLQDNLSIITTKNGFGYRADDYLEDLNEATTPLSSASFNLNGIVSTSIDKDAFRIVLTQVSTIHVDAIPYNLGSANDGANLDIKVLLFDETQKLLRTYDPSTSLSVTIDTSLRAGIYYLVLDGTGNANSSDYGSLGSYTITGFRNALAVRNVTLNGNATKGKHNLSWTLVADEPIKSQTIEVSTNGSNFTMLSNENTAARYGSYATDDEATKYYRVKVISSTDQITYSNIIALKGTEQINPFKVSTLVSSFISVNATENYQYKLMDSNGRLVAIGKGISGSNRIEMMNRPSGMYYVQLFYRNQVQTERIVKQ